MNDPRPYGQGKPDRYLANGYYGNWHSRRPGVRLTHLPTLVWVECIGERSLRTCELSARRLLRAALAKFREQGHLLRRTTIVRTYNNHSWSTQVTDHETGQTGQFGQLFGDGIPDLTPYLDARIWSRAVCRLPGDSRTASQPRGGEFYQGTYTIDPGASQTPWRKPKP